MNCAELNELSPLWHSGELDASQQRAFDAHLAICDSCSAEIRRQWTGDADLREAIDKETEIVDTRGLEQRVMRQIARERMGRWLAAGMAAAAALIAAVLILHDSRSVADSAIVKPLFTAAAHDHTLEVIGNAPRHWKTDAADIASLESAQGISDSDVRSLEASGYRLERAKVCRLGSTPYMHLVYSKGGREFSVFMRVRGDQPLPEEASSSGILQLASFARGRVQAVIVTDAPRGECSQITRDAEAAL